MEQKKAISFIGLGVLAAFLTGCTGNNASAENDIMSVEEQIDELEVEGATHVTIPLDEHIYVDADVTPYEDYKNGLNVYNIAWPTEGGEGYIVDDFTETPMLFWQDFDTQIGYLLEQSNRELSLSDMVVEHNSSYINVSAELSDYILNINWDLDEEGKMHTCLLQYGSDAILEAFDSMFSYKGNLQNCLAKDVDTEIGQAAAAGKEMVESFLSLEMSEDYYCVPVDGVGENAYIFMYPPQIDGFPVIHETRSMHLDDTIDISLSTEDFQSREASRTVINLYMKPMWLFYEDGNITGAFIRNTYEMEDLYQENMECIDLKEVLSQTANFFDKILVTEDIVITNIQLGYSSWIIEEADGSLQDIATPYWYVRYYSEEDGNCCLLIDALTGEAVELYIFLDPL